MRHFVLAGLAILLGWLLNQDKPNTEGNREQYFRNKKLSAALCAPVRDRSLITEEIGLLPGTGKHHWKISASHDSAQIYFDQGMNLYYSFHIIESLASFLKAQKFDPQSPMLYWAEALAYGPNINDLGYTQSPDAMTAVANARKYAANGSPLEKGLIEAMALRYSEDQGATRENLNVAYRDAMAALYNAHPRDPEVIALYADALMVMHPWDLYEGNGNPKAWTPELVTVLENGLNADNLHPGLNHYYIHAVEGSRDPGRGLPSADRLGGIVPSAAHMVHMPSHIYIRTGDYAKGIDVNVKSLKSHQAYLTLYPAVVNNLFIYQYHNTHMLAACAIMNGNSKVALNSAQQCHDDITPDLFAKEEAPYNEMIQYIYATPIFAMVRYGKWDELLALNIPDSLHYYNILGDFGKAIALARKGDVEAAERTLKAMAEKMEVDPALKIRAFNTAYDAAMVAKTLAEGIIAEEKGEMARAEELLMKAADLEEAMVYNEPKDWLLPPLQYLGQVQLKAGKFAAAEKTFRKDLGFNPHNIWSLRGLHQSLVKQSKPEAKSIAQELEKSGKGADVKVQYSVY
jgi:hypothetical protein